MLNGGNVGAGREDDRSRCPANVAAKIGETGQERDSIRRVRAKAVARTYGDLVSMPGHLRRAVAGRDQKDAVETAGGARRTVAHHLVERKLHRPDVHVRRARVRRDRDDLRWCVVFRPTRRRARRARTPRAARGRRRLSAAQRPHLVDELLALGFHLIQDRPVVRHHLLGRAFDVLRIVQTALAATRSASPAQRLHREDARIPCRRRSVRPAGR